MQVPKFKEFITETDIGRRDKPITVAIVTVADSKDPKENTTADLIQKACKKKSIKCIIVNTKSTIITAKDEDKIPTPARAAIDSKTRRPFLDSRSSRTDIALLVALDE